MGQGNRGGRARTRKKKDAALGELKGASQTARKTIYKVREEKGQGGLGQNL